VRYEKRGGVSTSTHASHLRGWMWQMVVSDKELVAREAESSSLGGNAPCCDSGPGEEENGWKKNRRSSKRGGRVLPRRSQISGRNQRDPHHVSTSSPPGTWLISWKARAHKKTPQKAGWRPDTRATPSNEVRTSRRQIKTRLLLRSRRVVGIKDPLYRGFKREKRGGDSKRVMEWDGRGRTPTTGEVRRRNPECHH